jgi:hypothetical protein
MASGNPSSMTSLLPGGAGVQVSGTTSVPFLASPRVEQIVREVLDISSSGGLATPAVNGNLLVLNFSAANNSGGGLWQLPQVVGASHIPGAFGIVLKAGSTASIDENPVGSGVGALVVTQGPVQALCVAPSAGGAIALGTLLESDGTGNLQPLQPPSAAPTPTVATVGSAGSTTYTYALVSVGANGVATAIGTATAITTGNATLSTTNYNQISWTPKADAAYYLIVRTTAGGTPSTVGTIGEVTGDTDTFNDTGLAIATGTSATQPFETLAVPSAPTVTPVGTAGSTSYSYKVASIGANGVWSAASTAGSTSTGNATLSTSNYNQVTWTVVAGATAYAIQRSAGGATQGLIGTATSAQATSGFNDYGIAATTYTQNVTPTPSPASGVVIAKSLGTLASGTTTPTLTPVWVGGPI